MPIHRVRKEEASGQMMCKGVNELGTDPSPEGRGWDIKNWRARVRGHDRLFLFYYPSPAASRHPLPSGEGFVPKISTPQFRLPFILSRKIPYAQGALCRRYRFLLEDGRSAGSILMPLL